MSEAKPRILFLDIETFPDLVWVWTLWKANAIDVKRSRVLVSFSAEWDGGGVITRAWSDYPKRESDTEREFDLLDELWKLVDEADIIVAHNGIDFDMKVINARFIEHGFDPPSPYKVVDTLRAIKKIASYSSHKLDFLSSQFELGRKLKHEGFELWKGCMENDPKWWKKMKKYNRHDVVLLKRLYHRIAPWISQPTAGIWALDAVCPNPACGSKKLQKRGLARTLTRVYHRFQCQECGAWGRSTSAEKAKATVVKVS
jgi:DNA polymerase elongation subunit (family B)